MWEGSISTPPTYMDIGRQTGQEKRRVEIGAKDTFLHVPDQRKKPGYPCTSFTESHNCHLEEEKTESKVSMQMN